jgi:hypothetical protein
LESGSYVKTETLQQHRETLVDLRGTLEKAELELEPMMKEDQPNESQVLGPDRQSGAGTCGAGESQRAILAGQGDPLAADFWLPQAHKTGWPSSIQLFETNAECWREYGHGCLPQIV